ncbi:PCNP [Branchiostoma lanceolatum]|uniref:PEST proteolytic signal-containing nuclear protein n=1 Tax=Branchiostoma lanceolatum TaxID=7740 RepID=A0A8J9VY82_BRALA|nr:PCNP [Branchiostoma lanceolatum]
MADNNQEDRAPTLEDKLWKKTSPTKRKADGDDDIPERVASAKVQKPSGGISIRLGGNLPAAPPKNSPGAGFVSTKTMAPISIKLGANKPKPSSSPAAQPVKKVAAVFAESDDDDEPEEMPPEAKMRMKNIGRDTPTSAGPNSFNKGRIGFCDKAKMWERDLKAKADKLSKDK